MEESSDEKQDVRRKKSAMPEEFPDEETTVYVDVPVRKQVLEHPQPRQTELFDVEEALKQSRCLKDPKSRKNRNKSRRKSRMNRFRNRNGWENRWRRSAKQHLLWRYCARKVRL